MKCPECKAEMPCIMADGDGRMGDVAEFYCKKCDISVEVQRKVYPGKSEMAKRSTDRVLCGEVKMKKGIPLQMFVGTDEVNAILEQYQEKKIYLKIMEC